MAQLSHFHRRRRHGKYLGARARTTAQNGREAGLLRVGAATGVAHFIRRYGLRGEPTLVRFRILDPALAVGGLTDLSVPVEQFALLDLLLERVYITENLINGLAFPDCQKSMVVFGLGYGVERLADAAWLRKLDVHYWGDIDTHGYGILNRLRAVLPEAKSMLMDDATLHAHRELWGQEPADKRYLGERMRLTPEEYGLFDALRRDRYGERVRLEQERIGWGALETALQSLQ